MPNTLVSRMCLMYGPPETHDDAAWFREMDRLLAGYSEAILNRAADIVMTTHRGARFPALSVMKDACDQACEEATPKDHGQAPKHPDWLPQAVARATKLIQCELGRTAANEGWILGLHDFCRKHGRLPNGREISQIIAENRQFDRAYDLCANGQGGVLSAALAKLGETFIARRHKYAALVQTKGDHS